MLAACGPRAGRRLQGRTLPPPVHTPPRPQQRLLSLYPFLRQPHARWPWTRKRSRDSDGEHQLDDAGNATSTRRPGSYRRFGSERSWCAAADPADAAAIVQAGSRGPVYARYAEKGRRCPDSGNGVCTDARIHPIPACPCLSRRRVTHRNSHLGAREPGKEHAGRALRNGKAETRTITPPERLEALIVDVRILVRELLRAAPPTYIPPGGVPRAPDLTQDSRETKIL